MKIFQTVRESEFFWAGAMFGTFATIIVAVIVYTFF